uniref:Uncharacterized protein n=1 Tax=Rhizophora mucronata TaxID=61149 RepID=A0A2P2NUP1_RHIMU
MIILVILPWCLIVHLIYNACEHHLVCGQDAFVYN